MNSLNTNYRNIPCICPAYSWTFGFREGKNDFKNENGRKGNHWTYIPGYLPRWENKVVKEPLKELRDQA